LKGWRRAKKIALIEASPLNVPACMGSFDYTLSSASPRTMFRSG
jgi:hypothetical protein